MFKAGMGSMVISKRGQFRIRGVQHGVSGLAFAAVLEHVQV